MIGLICPLLAGVAWIVCSITLMRGSWKAACWTGGFGFGCYAVGFIAVG
jgi:hypothetical protein